MNTLTTQHFFSLKNWPVSLVSCKVLSIIIIIITKEYDYGGVMSRGLQGHLTNEIVRRESQRDK